MLPSRMGRTLRGRTVEIERRERVKEERPKLRVISGASVF